MPRLAKILMVAAIGLAIGGIGLTLAQPGDLGDGDNETADTTAPTQLDDRDTSVPDDDDEDAPSGDGVATGPEQEDTSTTSSTTASTTSTTAPTDGGSGLGSDGAADADDTSNGLVNTGGESMLAAAAFLALMALALRPRHPGRVSP